MVMGRDILFFWACRMIMMSLYTKREIPFKTLYLTGLITDRHGKKMSKSKGNGIDPLEMVDKYGTDALRLSLFIGSSAGNDMRLYEEKIEGFRNFVNKLWNASRFVQMTLDSAVETQNLASLQDAKFSNADKWILHRTNELITEVTAALDNYKYGEAGQKLYDFTWNEFCDWYLELSKGEKQNPAVLKEVLKNLLLLLHPFIPFVTEAIAKEMSLFVETQRVASLQMVSPLLATTQFPEPKSDWHFPEASENIALLIETITAIRKLRTESKVEVSKKIQAIIVTEGKEGVFLQESAEEIKKLARLETLQFVPSLIDTKETVSSIITSQVAVYLPLAGMVDMRKEQERVAKEREALQKQLEQMEGRLQNAAYREKAPAHLIADTEKKIEEIKEKLGKMG